MTEELNQSTTDEMLKEKLQANVNILCKGDLEERLKAVDYLIDELKQSTSSMTSVPKPMKHLISYLPMLKEAYDTFTNAEYKQKLGDLLSLLSIINIEKSYDILTYRLASPVENIGCWGHEYVRCLTLVLERASKNPQDFPDFDQLSQLVAQISKYYMEHNDEPDACDLLLAVDHLPDIIQLVDEESHKRVCTYLLQNFNYLLDPLNVHVLQIVEKIYTKLGKTVQAMVIALKLNDHELMHKIFSECTDPSIKKQLAFLLARQLIVFEDEMDEEIVEIATNTELFSRFTEISKRLQKSKPKTPDDVLQLQSTLGSINLRNQGSRDTKSLSLIAKSFVAAFHNAGIKEDLYYTAPRGNECIGRNHGIGRAIAIATLGMLNLWDIETGLNTIGSWTENKEDDYIIMGALTGVGIISSAVRSEFDPAKAMLADYLENKKEDIKIGAIIGFAMAYAGSAREDILENLSPLLTEEEPRIRAFASLAIGLVFVGTCNDSALGFVSEMIIQTSDDSKSIAHLIPIMALGLGLIFLGKQSGCEAALVLLKASPSSLSLFAHTTIIGCAYAGTGNVKQIEKMLQICSETPDSMQHAAAVLSIAAICVGDSISTQMAKRMFEHIMQYGKSNARQMVPIALALTSISQPLPELVDTLHRYGHDEMKISLNAIIAIGLLAAGTQNTRAIGALKQLEHYHKSSAQAAQAMMLLQIAEGMTHLGQGLMTLSPTYGDSLLLHPVALGSLLAIAFSCIAPLQRGGDNERTDPLILKEPLMFFFVAPAIGLRFLATLDEDLNILPLQVRVGQAIDTVGQAGEPRNITAFQTLDTPVLLAAGQRANFADDTYEPLSPILEGFVIVRKRTEQKTE